VVHHRLDDGEHQLVPQLVERADVVPRHVRDRRETLALRRWLHLREAAHKVLLGDRQRREFSVRQRGATRRAARAARRTARRTARRAARVADRRLEDIAEDPIDRADRRLLAQRGEVGADESVALLGEGVEVEVATQTHRLAEHS